MYFIFSFIINLILVFILFVGIISTINMIKKNRIKKQYFVLIVLFIVGLPIIVFNKVIPTAMDLKKFTNKNYEVCEGVSNSCGGSEVPLSGNWFEYNPWEFKPRVNEKYTVYYLPNCRFIMQWKK